jgi:hypothetical protein
MTVTITAGIITGRSHLMSIITGTTTATTAAQRDGTEDTRPAGEKAASPVDGTGEIEIEIEIMTATFVISVVTVETGIGIGIVAYLPFDLSRLEQDRSRLGTGLGARMFEPRKRQFSSKKETDIGKLEIV